MIPGLPERPSHGERIGGLRHAVRKQFEDTGRRYAILEVARRLKAHKVLAANAVIHYQEIEVPVQHAHDGEEVDN